jgi:lipid II:glycine glycyltransferase (peptidoglycan interpeptide bridge formation enzyme)
MSLCLLRCYTVFMARHVVQSPEWGDFKSEYGTQAINAGGVQYTKHCIPFTKYFFGYCPKVDPFEIKFDELKKSLKDNDCVNINFDVPNVIKGTEEEARAIKLFESQGCVLAPRDQFAKANVILDISRSEEELLAAMHQKQRYNIKYAEKNGVTAKVAETQEDFDIFWEMFESTSIRQKYYIRPKSYYQKIWNKFKDTGMVHILTVSYKDEPLASWMLFTYENVLYYPYGGSSEKHRNLFGSTYLGWQAILLGKKFGCKLFDMWGASENPENSSDPWWGFTNFKLKYGGEHVTYMNSYDLVVNPVIYKAFTAANDMRWKFLKLLK